MRLVIQRVEHASVVSDGVLTGSIGKGYMVLLGVGKDDAEKDCERLAAKLIKLRIFEDGQGKTNLSLKDVNGALLIVSQFTLYADCSSGNRPFFGGGKPPEEANRLYEYFVELCRREVGQVETGVFGANMKVELLNDGPFTIILE